MNLIEKDHYTKLIPELNMLDRVVGSVDDIGAQRYIYERSLPTEVLLGIKRRIDMGVSNKGQEGAERKRGGVLNRFLSQIKADKKKSQEQFAVPIVTSEIVRSNGEVGQLAYYVDFNNPVQRQRAGDWSESIKQVLTSGDSVRIMQTYLDLKELPVKRSSPAILRFFSEDRGNYV